MLDKILSLIVENHVGWRESLCTWDEQGKPIDPIDALVTHVPGAKSVRQILKEGAWQVKDKRQEIVAMAILEPRTGALIAFGDTPGTKPSLIQRAKSIINGLNL